MNILNLYAGIGGNRTLWGDEHHITAVEYDADIAAVYAKRFPNDEVIVADAHEFLLRHVREFDFVWSSPPCITHSRLNIAAKSSRYRKSIARYPDMSLWQEIIFLGLQCSRSAWVVENVIPYYKSLVEPVATIGRHLFWSNLPIKSEERPAGDIKNYHKKTFADKYDVPLELLDGFNAQRQRQILRNCVEPEIGRQILDIALGIKREKDVVQLALNFEDGSALDSGEECNSTGRN